MSAIDRRRERRGSRVPWRRLAGILAAALAGAAQPARAADDPAASPEIRLHRAAGAIAIDGDLSDPGWQGATRVETFFETNPADNVPASVKTVAYLTYDDRYFYAAFEFFDPDPATIRAPLGVRDNTPSYTDYGGVILDSKHDGKTGVLLLANPKNVQYDAITDDVTGNEDSSYDLFWDSATRIMP